jgi:two-component sensor histidine kinase
LRLLSQDKVVITNLQQFTSEQGTTSEKQQSYDSLSNRFQNPVQLEMMSHISVLNPQTGQIQISSEPSWIGMFREHEEYFEKGREGLFVSEIFYSLSMGRPTMVLSGPMNDSNGKLLGVLALHAKFEQLSDIMLERTGLSETTETFLVNKSNLLLTDTVFAPNMAFKKWIFGEGAVRAIKGESDVDLFVDYRNKRVIGAYFWLPERNLALIAKQDVEEAFAPIGDLRRTIIFIGICIILLVITVAIFFGKQIVAPIKALVEGTKVAGQGNLDYRINSTALNEIGTLSNAFDQMVENLKNITISLDEKEVLLREIHHRVKNNLQMVQSLLSLQLNQFSSSEAVGPIKDSMHRITSIAMVHETLYKSKDLSTINLAEYFQDLVGYLMKSLRPSESLVEIECRIEQLPIHLDAVISCGLIVNELITNALKYAFLPDKRGKIRVELRDMPNNMVELMVSDNGVGIEDIDNIRENGSLGIKLVHILAENQLDGTLEIKNSSGLKYIIHFVR